MNILILRNMNILIMMIPVSLLMVLKQTNLVFFHLHLMEKVLTLASLGVVDPDPGVQLQKIMKGANGAFVAKHVQLKVCRQN